MDRLIVEKLLNDSKLFDHFLHHSYWVKQLNRDSRSFDLFKSTMKSLYKERMTDKINNAIDGIELISSLIDNQ